MRGLPANATDAYIGRVLVRTNRLALDVCHQDHSFGVCSWPGWHWHPKVPGGSPCDGPGGAGVARACWSRDRADDAIERDRNHVIEKKSDWRAVFAPELRRVLLLGVVLAVFQQWCGVNVIFNYSEEIFRGAGFDISTILVNVAWTGSVNLYSLSLHWGSWIG